MLQICSSDAPLGILQMAAAKKVRGPYACREIVTIPTWPIGSVEVSCRSREGLQGGNSNFNSLPQLTDTFLQDVIDATQQRRPASTKSNAHRIAITLFLLSFDFNVSLLTVLEGLS